MTEKQTRVFKDYTICEHIDGTCTIECDDTSYLGQGYLKSARFSSYGQAYMVAHSFHTKMKLRTYQKAMICLIIGLTISVAGNLALFMEMLL